MSDVNNKFVNRPIFGTMRLGFLDAGPCTDLLTYYLEQGGYRFHSSFEYESFSPFKHALQEACSKTGTDPNKIAHLVKIAAPHFDEDQFDPKQLREKILRYCDSLQCNTIETIQWMLRYNLKDEPGRLQRLEQARDSIMRTVSDLKSEKLISRFGCFPYTQSFRARIYGEPWCDVLFDYFNPLENTSSIEFDELSDHQSFIGIRPFYPLQNDTKDEHEAKALLNYALAPKKCESVIASASTVKHLEEFMAFFKSQRTFFLE